MPVKYGLVTGASSGIGRATAIALAREGWYLSLTARREKELQDTVELCIDAANVAPSNTDATNDAFVVTAGDITDESFVKELFAQTKARFGRLDMIFNNAGASAPPTPTEDLSLETLTKVLNVNLIGPFLCAREAIRIFKEQEPKGGRIINNGSLSAHTPRPHSVAYTTSKHAIAGLTKSISLDGRDHGITCTQVDIGNVHTALSTGGSVGGLGQDYGTDVLHVQPNGQIAREATFEVEHVASQIAAVAALPNSVTVLWLRTCGALHAFLMSLLTFCLFRRATKMPYVGRG